MLCLYNKHETHFSVPFLFFIASPGAYPQPCHRLGLPFSCTALGRIDRTDPALAGREIYICGGAQVYRQALPLCSDLYLTLVQRLVEGDTLFPPFEDEFELAEEVLARPEFKILHYRARAL